LGSNDRPRAREAEPPFPARPQGGRVGAPVVSPVKVVQHIEFPRETKKYRLKQDLEEREMTLDVTSQAIFPRNTYFSRKQPRSGHLYRAGRLRPRLWEATIQAQARRLLPAVPTSHRYVYWSLLFPPCLFTPHCLRKSRKLTA